MFKKMILAAAFVFVLMITNAGAGVDFGIQGDWSKSEGRNSGDWGVGARLDFGGSIRGIIAFDYYFINADDFFDEGDFTEDDLDLNFWEVNGNVVYQFPTETVHPYIGGGVGFARRKLRLINFFDDNRTELGINALGGIKFGDSIQPFVELRYTFFPDDNDELADEFPDLGDGVRFSDRFIVSAGILF